MGQKKKRDLEICAITLKAGLRIKKGEIGIIGYYFPLLKIRYFIGLILTGVFAIFRLSYFLHLKHIFYLIFNN